MDWKDVVRTVAPSLGMLAGGPLVGGVVKVLADQVLGDAATGDPVTDEAALASVLSGGLTPELRGKIIDADNAMKLALVNAGVREKEIAADVEKGYLSDVQDARKAHAGNHSLMPLSAVILLVWAVLMTLTLIGLYGVATKGIEIKDVGLAATVFTVLGSLIGYATNAAQQVVGYWFGSSHGSSQKTEVLANSITTAGRR